MTERQTQAFRQQLLNLERHGTGDVDALEDEALHKTDGKAVGNLSNIPVADRAELSFDIASAEATLGLIEHATVRRQEILDALARLDAGTFGRCVTCARRISIRRLRSTPYVSRCITCARTAEHGDPPVPGNL